MEPPDPKFPDSPMVRPMMQAEEFSIRGDGISGERLQKIRKGLLTLHTLETMAANLYQFQITRDRTELNRQLIIANCNQMSHIQDFQIKLLEYGWKPSRLRWAFWMLGLVLGFGSRLLGPRLLLRTASWVEQKAVEHYGELLEAIEWEEDLRRIIERDRADEEGHLRRWHSLLESG